MDKNLQTISDFIQQYPNMPAEQKDSVLMALKAVDKELQILSFKLDRTEKVKRTTAILLEETIEELEQKRNAVEETLAELKSTQAQLVQQEKLASLGQLTAGIAHEIKNPLNFVNNFSEVSIEMIEEAMEERAKSQESRDETLVDEILEDIKSNLKKVHEHGTRANGIVTSMLQHSREGSGKKEPTNLNALTKEYVNLSFHGMRAGKNPINVIIDLQLDEQIKEIPLIGEDFSRVLLNLCNNSFDAMRGKMKKYEEQSTKYNDGAAVDVSYLPKLTVSTILEKGQVRISFEDNGTGIPDEIKDKILQPFFTTKKGTEGTGLGLSITHDIIKAHGGELNIESNPDNGAHFIISLPISPIQ
jgi:signal transduction histidine kinase